MKQQDIIDHLEYALDRLGRNDDTEYGRSCLLKALGNAETNNLYDCAYEIRSFPLEASGVTPQELQDWAEKCAYWKG